MLQLSDVIGIKKEVRSATPDPELPLNDQYIGVEVEVEGAQDISVNGSKYWTEVADGSLRDGGKEFIFTEPLYNSDIKKALNELARAFKGHPPTISSRCSVHVHLNVSDMNAIQLHRLLILYLIFERTIIKYHAIREDNIFAIPFYKASHYISRIDALFREDYREIERMLAKMNKYQALNLATIPRYGSLEFRHMAGTANPLSIFPWIQIILQLKKYVLTYDVDPLTLLHNMSGIGPENFLDAVFEDHAVRLRNGDVERDVMKGVRLAQLSTINTALHDINAKHYRRRWQQEVQDFIDKALGIIDPSKLTFNLYGPVEGDL